MKLLTISFFTFYSLNLNASDAVKESLEYFNNGNYFLALDRIAKEYKYQSPDEKIKNYIENLTRVTGSYHFNTYSDLELRKINTPTTHLIMAKRNLYLKKYFYTFKRLNKIPKNHRLYPESLLVKGTAFTMKNNYKEAQKTYKECILKTEDFIKDNGRKNRIQKYYNYIKDTCMANLGRNEFERENFKDAQTYYNQIPKKSYIWPYILLEKAWAAYHLEDYNRALGILMTYESPLLQSYFLPEGEVLKALSYFKLCLYEDSNRVIENYYTTYKKRSEELLSILKRENNTPYYYLNLMFKNKEAHPFIKKLITQISKRIKYNLDLSSLKIISIEYSRTKNEEDKRKLEETKKDLKEQMNYFIKTQMFQFINSIHALSEEMFELKLEVVSRRRDLLYKNKELTETKARGDFQNIKKKVTDHYWTFENAFWADELGDYSFGLKSKCKETEIK